jgi:hypothetical protein
MAPELVVRGLPDTESDAGCLDFRVGTANGLRALGVSEAARSDIEAAITGVFTASDYLPAEGVAPVDHRGVGQEAGSRR